MARGFHAFFKILGTIEKEWIWANSSINEYQYYLKEIREMHDEYMKMNPKRTFPGKDFFSKFPYPVHPQYAIDVITEKVDQIMEEAYGNNNRQTLLHC